MQNTDSQLFFGELNELLFKLGHFGEVNTDFFELFINLFVDVQFFNENSQYFVDSNNDQLKIKSDENVAFLLFDFLSGELFMGYFFVHDCNFDGNDFLNFASDEHGADSDEVDFIGRKIILGLGEVEIHYFNG